MNFTQLLFLLGEWEQTKCLLALRSELLGVVLFFWITRGIFASAKVTMTRKTDRCWIGVGWDHLMAEAIFLDGREDIGKPCIYNSNEDCGQRTFSSKTLVKLESYSALQWSIRCCIMSLQNSFITTIIIIIDSFIIHLIQAKTEDHALNSFVFIILLLKMENTSLMGMSW